MGVGKSVIGRRVAGKLGFDFFDSDRRIEMDQGKPIHQIFADSGESGFRKLEREYMETGHPDSNSVISCGGGTVVQAGMKELLERKGVVICLSASVKSIFKRTIGTRHRPLLNVDDPEKKVRQLIKEREPIYRQFDICIATDGRSIAEVTGAVLRAYKAHA